MIEFRASLKATGKYLKIDSEGESELILSVPALDIAEVIRMISMQGKSFTVRIDEG